jgi:hypothetical protein
MKTLLVAVLCASATAGTVQAQETILDIAQAGQNAAATFSGVAVESEALPLIPSTLNCSLPGVSLLTSSALGSDTGARPSPLPTASPAPNPKFVFGGRDDFRWQIGIGADGLWFRSSIFNASAVGIAGSASYFTNDWFAFEGAVTTAFAPEIFDREHVKLLVYGAGPKIAWREHLWEPWAHALVGGTHEQPQTAGNSRNAFAVVLGGGADYRFHPRFAARFEADWVRTSYFSQGQSNFELMGGIVFHF